jgi:hypothetical protein
MARPWKMGPEYGAGSTGATTVGVEGGVGVDGAEGATSAEDGFTTVAVELFVTLIALKLARKFGAVP